MGNLIDKVYLADDIGIYKPAPEVYNMIIDNTGLSESEILFSYANQWDVAGAAVQGIQVAWVNRKKEAQESIAQLPNVPKVTGLRDIFSLIKGL